MGPWALIELNRIGSCELLLNWIGSCLVFQINTNNQNQISPSTTFLHYDSQRTKIYKISKLQALLGLSFCSPLTLTESGCKMLVWLAGEPANTPGRRTQLGAGVGRDPPELETNGHRQAGFCFQDFAALFFFFFLPFWSLLSYFWHGISSWPFSDPSSSLGV